MAPPTRCGACSLAALARQIDDYSLVSFIPLDLSKEDSIAYMLQHVDGAIQYGEDADVRTSSADADEP